MRIRQVRVIGNEPRAVDGVVNEEERFGAVERLSGESHAILGILFQVNNGVDPWGAAALLTRHDELVRMLGADRHALVAQPFCTRGRVGVYHVYE